MLKCANRDPVETLRIFKNHNLLGLFCGGAKLDKIIQKNFEKKFSVTI